MSPVHIHDTYTYQKSLENSIRSIAKSSKTLQRGNHSIHSIAQPSKTLRRRDYLVVGEDEEATLPCTSCHLQNQDQPEPNIGQLEALPIEAIVPARAVFSFPGANFFPRPRFPSTTVSSFAGRSRAFLPLLAPASSPRANSVQGAASRPSVRDAAGSPRRRRPSVQGAAGSPSRSLPPLRPGRRRQPI
ncbi:hypothetical protein [Oryza sativa Japonica Group]|uniref:Uncharacterized protein n=2 Tax=Oryza sativa subsp. japonica TaxID=39947 RepID=Q5JKC4_ORYSJ|nr:hypothetical protein [Oryza sativa Japonica Group]BAD88280.1 hypothetical protein [Oryza sativa Japonica Group]